MDDVSRMYSGNSLRSGVVNSSVSSPAAPAGLPGASASGASVRPWTDDEINVVRRRFGKETLARLAMRLDRSPASVRSLARRLGMVGRLSSARFSPEDDELLRKMVGQHSYKHIAQVLGRTVDAVEKRASRLKLTRRRSEFWTNDELDTLRALYDTKTNREIGKEIGRSGKAVERKARDLGLPQKVRREAEENANIDVRPTLEKLPPLGPGYGPRIVHRIGL